jgi:hypothetical protein
LDFWKLPYQTVEESIRSKEIEDDEDATSVEQRFSHETITDGMVRRTVAMLKTLIDLYSKLNDEIRVTHYEFYLLNKRTTKISIDDQSYSFSVELLHSMSEIQQPLIGLGFRSSTRSSNWTNDPINLCHTRFPICHDASFVIGEEICCLAVELVPVRDVPQKKPSSAHSLHGHSSKPNCQLM